MLEYTFRPLTQWPGPRTRRSTRARFQATFSQTMDLLERELRHLGARRAIIQADVDERDVRLDGMLRSDARPRSPAIIVSFQSKHGPLSYPCDTFDHWKDNLRAIALALEALRAVDRYGVTRKAEQYRGWQQLPPPAMAQAEFGSRSEALIYLSGLILRLTGRSQNGLSDEQLIREAEKRTHPDTGGDAQEFKRVQQARRIILGK